MWLLKREQLAVTGVGAWALTALLLLIWQQPKRLHILSETPPASAIAWESRLSRARQVDLNTASVSELTRLPGVGPALAQRIVQYRDTHGRFSTLEDLAKVHGIGPKTIDALRDHLLVH